ncbi:uncharacterized protein LOC122499705 [Leptopilina heterotoma]|uniref:uncharacterized protein LOC122499705 n=1 Tax=Leptopilina heterotoma TaxID=63436 RepID=UPI001CA975C2|nr:uncharacterized protein LOC122499705 [Leptopilina heterotoma]
MTNRRVRFPAAWNPGRGDFIGKESPTTFSPLVPPNITLQDNNEDLRLKSFTIRFGPWEEAPFRKSQGDAWYFSKFIQNTVESKPYSRGCWHQEYFWDGSKRKYYVRGFWATVSSMIVFILRK